MTTRQNIDVGRAAGRTSPIANFRPLAVVVARPVWPFTRAEALVYYEAATPGGEFNEALADLAIELEEV